MGRGTRKVSRRVRRSSASRPWQPLERRDLYAAQIVGSTASYATIQAAVNAAAPGAVINVSAGTYAEKVTITKPGLTIRGPQAGVDARGNARAAAIAAGKEAVLTGATVGTNTVSCIFYVNADDVTIDGFTVQGESQKDSAVGAGIVLAPSIAGSRVLNNVVQNNYAGLFLSNDSDADACLIQGNVFRDNYNPNDTQGYAYSGNDNRHIYTDGGVSGGKLTNVTIDNNAFYYDLVPPDYVEGAIGFESYTKGSQTNLRVTNNVMDGVGKGILYYNVDGLTISGNTVTDVGDVWSGVFRDEGNSDNVTITYNNVYDGYGPFLRIDNRATPGNSSGYHVNYNNSVRNGYTVNGGISFQQQTGKNAAVYVDPGGYDSTLDLTRNWWGTTAGPGSTVVSASSTPLDVAVSPWLSAPAVNVEPSYLGVTPTDGAPVQAEFYNHGGKGVAYANANTTSPGSKYRNGETVGVIAAADTGGGFAVGSTKAGDWLDYNVTVTAAGTYRFDLRYLSTAAATVHATVDGTNVTGTLSLATTAGKWATFSKAGLALSAGTHVVRLYVDSGAPTLNWFQMTNAGTPPPTAAASLSATAQSATAVVLTWGNTSATQTGVKVQRSTDGNTWTTLTTTANNWFVDASAAAGTTYRYRAVATGAGGDAAASNVATATTFAAAAVPQYLSDLTWTSATAGYGSVTRDATVAAKPITLAGTTYAKGIGTHANSTVVYALGGQYTTFAADVGVDDEVLGKGQGSVVFQVIGDGVKLYDSGVVSVGTVKRVSVNVAGVKTLQLIATDAGDGNSFDHADWAGAAVYGTPTVPLSPTNLSVKLATTTTAALTWTAGSANATGYAVQRSTDGVTFATVGTTTTTAFTDAGPLAAGGTYTYRVVATNGQGGSPASAAVSVVTPAAGTVTSNLSDLTPTSATTGYGTVQKDRTVSGKPITLAGVVYAKGVGVHAVSQLVYPLGGQYTTFASDVGVDDAAGGAGQVVFQVFGDGVKLYDSGVLTRGQAATHLSVNVAGVQQLTLVATTGPTGSIDYAHADWAGATLTGTPTAPAVPANLAATATTPTSVKLTWTPAGTNVATYTLERSANNGAWTTVSSTIAGTATSYVDASAAVVANTPYQYRLTAVNAAGASAATAPVRVATPSAQATTYVSDLTATSATAGYGTVQKDRSSGGRAITLAGTAYAKGLGTHASSTVTYDLTAKAYQTFAATVGVDDEENGLGLGTVRFQVIGDGVVLFDSGVLTNGQTADVAVSVAGVKSLQLVATDGGDGIDYDHADWAGARLLS